MPDAFFTTKPRNRKRASSKVTGPSSSKKVLKTSNGRRTSANGKGKVRTADEDLHSDRSESVALEDMDLRADEVDPNDSGDEDAGETLAEGRLRLAKLYLQRMRRPTRPKLTRSWHLISSRMCLITRASYTQVTRGRL